MLVRPERGCCRWRWLTSAGDLPAACTEHESSFTCGCVAELFELNTAKFFFRLSDSKSKSVPYWLDCLLRLEVTWLSLMPGASCVGTKEREDVRMPAVAQNSVIRCGHVGNAFFAQLSLFVKGPLASHPKGGLLPSPASDLPPPPGDLVAEAVMWGNTGSRGYRPLRLEQRGCFDHRAPSLIL